MARRLLTWNRTDLPSQPQDDYTGLDLDQPFFRARVYLSAGGMRDRPWKWSIVHRSAIANGNEASLEGAIDAAERAYATWQKRW
jgi:hypothetical protein